MTIEIRRAQPDDLGPAGLATVAAYAEFYPQGSGHEDYVTHIGDVAGRAGHTTVLVGLVDAAVAGSVTIELEQRIEREMDPPGPEEGHIRMLGVDPVFRGRGVGRALVEGCIDEIRAAGRSVVTLDTTAVMTVAQHLYERMGFTRVRTFHAWGMDFISYALALHVRSPQ